MKIIALEDHTVDRAIGAATAEIWLALLGWRYRVQGEK